MSHDLEIEYQDELQKKGFNGLTLVNLLSGDMPLLGSLDTLNYNYYTLYDYATAIENVYYEVYYPVLKYFIEYRDLLYSSLSLYENEHTKWSDFLSVVPQYSAKWIKPYSVFYPEIIRNNFQLFPPIVPFSTNSNPALYISETDQNKITTWLKNYYPIKNNDETLNFLENQYFIVYAYVYHSDNRIFVLDQPESYTICATQTGIIRLHCQTRISGGWIQCNNAGYNCDAIRNCYPTLNVDCWYESPYLKSDGTPINRTDPVSVKQIVMSKIQANLRMNYEDRRENDTIATLVFKVVNCDWVYTGTNLPYSI